MHSHVSMVHNSQANYLKEISRERCKHMHRDGVLHLGTDRIIDNLKANGTYYRSLTLAGKIGNDGSCSGTQYSGYYGTWDNVIVQANTIITLKIAYVPVQLDAGRIVLRSGISCAFSDGTCLDPDDGYAFWHPVPEETCKFNRYDVLYEGKATKMRGLYNSRDSHLLLHH